ncbi:MAG: LLM class flavin-dependent oxidoreductase [Acidimicrobiales bacterium]
MTDGARRPGLRHGVFLPPFNELADPLRLIALAQLAEARGWDGMFLWDHVLRRPEQAAEVADPWIALAGIACATSRLRIGTMVTPLVRRRPQVLARQVVSLDHLSRGRVTLGLGLGVDTTGELSRFGELTDPVARGDLLDEGAALLASLMSGEQVQHRGTYFVADGVKFLPRPVQTPRVPMWLGARGSGASGRALRRAALYDGLFLIDAQIGDLARAVATIVSERGSLEGFEVAVLDVPEMPLDEAASLGATWAMLPIRPEAAASQVEELVDTGPPKRSPA